MRSLKKITVKDSIQFSKQLLFWAQKFNEVVWLDSNNYPQKYSRFDAVLAVKAQTELNSNYQKAFSKLQAYKTQVNDYIFGTLGYDLKNDLEALDSKNFDGLEFEDLYFFQPAKLFFIKGNSIEMLYLNEYAKDFEGDLVDIKAIQLNLKKKENKVKIKKRLQKKEYLKKLEIILKHLHRGDIYEVNFCQEFYALNAQIDSLEVYFKLNKISKPPFAAFLKIKNNYLLSASPERFAAKVKNTVISQPIKGTAKRLKNKKADEQLALQLEKDEKERSENIMIVDLVRNDLSKIAIKGSVQVEELCKVYSFDQVHQLISTIKAEVDHKTDAVKIIQHLFPMGSMTGAPKLSAMKIIEQQEVTKRGLYSGAIGYFTPQDDFDFNVVIRSILYNKNKKYLSFSVGGAITAKSDPEKEYQECLLKALAMRKALKN